MCARVCLSSSTQFIQLTDGQTDDCSVFIAFCLLPLLLTADAHVFTGKFIAPSLLSTIFEPVPFWVPFLLLFLPVVNLSGTISRLCIYFYTSCFTPTRHLKFNQVSHRFLRSPTTPKADEVVIARTWRDLPHVFVGDSNFHVRRPVWTCVCDSHIANGFFLRKRRRATTTTSATAATVVLARVVSDFGELVSHISFGNP